MQNIRDFRKKHDETNAKMLAKIIKHEPSACKAIQLTQLVTPGWSEGNKAFELTSAINERMETRIKDVLIQDRYSNRCVDTYDVLKFDQKNVSPLNKNETDIK